MAGATRDAEDVAREAASPPAGGRADHVTPGAQRPLAVAVDPSGRLLWQTSDVDGDHVVAILGHRVSDSYLAALRQRGVSYLFAGEGPGGPLDLAGALRQLRRPCSASGPSCSREAAASTARCCATGWSTR